MNDFDEATIAAWMLVDNAAEMLRDVPEMTPDQLWRHITKAVPDSITRNDAVQVVSALVVALGRIRAGTL